LRGSVLVENPAMAKTTNFLEEDEDFFSAEESGGTEEHETRAKDGKRSQPSRAARQRLDSRSEDLWLKRQLSDWDDAFEDKSRP
jgi:hypothetical protein